MHEAAVSNTVEVLLQSALDAHDAMETDLTGHEAEAASRSVLRVERNIHVTSRKGARAMAELSALRERFAAIEVLHEESRAL